MSKAAMSHGIQIYSIAAKHEDRYPTLYGSSVETLIEQWNGTDWSVVSSLSPGLLKGIAIVSANNIWAVGSVVDPNTGVTQTVIEQ